MLEKVNAYFKSGDFFPFLGRLRRNVLSPGFCSLKIEAKEIQITHLITLSGKPELQFCRSASFEHIDQFTEVLSQIVKEHRLEGTLCFWVLSDEHYQTLTMEALPVTAAEFQTAIRWKIQDSLPYPIDDAVIDYFPLPEQKGGSSNKMIMLVTSRLSYLKSFVKKIEDTGLKLSAIDIPELAMRNVTALYEKDEKATILIYLKEARGELLLTQSGQFYFIRRLEFGLEQLDGLDILKENVSSPLDKLSLEIQRSFDYYQTQWRLPAPSRIFLATVRHSVKDICHYLSKKLSLKVQPLDITSVMTTKQLFTLEEQGRFLIVLGEVLREVVEHVETTD